MITGIKATGEVFINGVILSPKESQKVYNHSPDGFGWNYRGSGPAQLALALLLFYTGDKRIAERYHQQFKEDVIARLEGDFKMPNTIILGWLQAKGIQYKTTTPFVSNIKSANKGKKYKSKMDFVTDTQEDQNEK